MNDSTNFWQHSLHLHRIALLFKIIALTRRRNDNGFNKIVKQSKSSYSLWASQRDFMCLTRSASAFRQFLHHNCIAGHFIKCSNLFIWLLNIQKQRKIIFSYIFNAVDSLNLLNTFNRLRNNRSWSRDYSVWFDCFKQRSFALLLFTLNATWIVIVH